MSYGMIFSYFFILFLGQLFFIFIQWLSIGTFGWHDLSLDSSLFTCFHTYPAVEFILMQGLSIRAFGRRGDEMRHNASFHQSLHCLLG